jgi:hypothetical protein
MKTYTYEQYKLTLEMTGRWIGEYPKARIKYVLSDDKGIIFSGDDFGASPMHDPDGPESAEALLSFLTLREGDTDGEYFDEYTERQVKFRDCEAEDLYYWQEKLSPEEHKRQ